MGSPSQNAGSVVLIVKPNKPLLLRNVNVFAIMPLHAGLRPVTMLQWLGNVLLGYTGSMAAARAPFAANQRSAKRSADEARTWAR
jgi:hypothetical protein